MSFFGPRHAHCTECAWVGTIIAGDMVGGSDWYCRSFGRILTPGWPAGARPTDPDAGPLPPVRERFPGEALLGGGLRSRAAAAAEDERQREVDRLLSDARSEGELKPMPPPPPPPHAE